MTAPDNARTLERIADISDIEQLCTEAEEKFKTVYGKTANEFYALPPKKRQDILSARNIRNA